MLPTLYYWPFQGRNSVTCKPSRNSKASFVRFVAGNFCVRAVVIQRIWMVYLSCMYLTISVGWRWGVLRILHVLLQCLTNGIVGAWAVLCRRARDNFAVTDGKCLTFHNGGNCLKHCIARDVPTRVAARTFVLLHTLQLSLWLGVGQCGGDVCLGVLLTSWTSLDRILSRRQLGAFAASTHTRL
jgi:hypothetical protein